MAVGRLKVVIVKMRIYRRDKAKRFCSALELITPNKLESHVVQKACRRNINTRKLV